MLNTPRRKRRPRETPSRMPYEIAKTLLGEETIKRRIRYPQLGSWWRSRGLPWHEAGPMLLEMLTLTTQANRGDPKASLELALRAARVFPEASLEYQVLVSALKMALQALDRQSGIG